MRINCLTAAFLCGALLFFACKKPDTAGLYHIGIVQIVEASLLDDARRGVVDALREAGFSDGRNIRLTYASAQGDFSNISIIIKELIASKVSMIITIGTPCMVSAANIVKNIPVVFTVAFSPDQLQMKDPPNNLTGVYDPATMSDLVQLIKKCMPGIKRLGIPYNPSEQNAVLAAEHMRAECRTVGIELFEMNVFSSNEVQQNVSALAQKNIEAMVISADNTLAAGIDAAIRICNDKKIPLFVTEPGEVERGACAGTGADFYEWGRQSGKMATEIIKSKKSEVVPMQKLASTVLYLNQSAAKKQGITFPKELIQKATKVIP